MAETNIGGVGYSVRKRRFFYFCAKPDCDGMDRSHGQEEHDEVFVPMFLRKNGAEGFAQGGIDYVDSMSRAMRTGSADAPGWDWLVRDDRLFDDGIFPYGGPHLDWKSLQAKRQLDAMRVRRAPFGVIVRPADGRLTDEEIARIKSDYLGPAAWRPNEIRLTPLFPWGRPADEGARFTEEEFALGGAA